MQQNDIDVQHHVHSALELPSILCVNDKNISTNK
jgi:hypothetical protein